MKKCSKCKTEKSLTEFNKHSGIKSGLHPSCRVCQGVSGKVSRLKHIDTRRAYGRQAALRRNYGITLAHKADLVAQQNGCCAICGTVFSGSFDTVVDHIHGLRPSIVRGILCRKCNTGLGQFKDSTERLSKAIEYLKKFQKTS